MMTQVSPGWRLAIGAAVAVVLYWACLAVAMILAPGDPLPAIAGVLFAWAAGAYLSGAFRGGIDPASLVAALGAAVGAAAGVGASPWIGHTDLSRFAQVVGSAVLFLMAASLLMALWFGVRAALGIFRAGRGSSPGTHPL